jgi:hypothetical protein
VVCRYVNFDKEISGVEFGNVPAHVEYFICRRVYKYVGVCIMNRYVDGTLEYKRHDPVFRWMVSEVCFRPFANLIKLKLHYWEIALVKLVAMAREQRNCRAWSAVSRGLLSGSTVGQKRARVQEHHVWTCSAPCSGDARFTSSVLRGHPAVCRGFPYPFLADPGVFTLDRAATTSNPLQFIVFRLSYLSMQCTTYRSLSCWRRY